jgi:hypothetical protein
VGAIWAFESAEVRNRYFDEHGNSTPLEQQAREKLAPIVEQLNQIGTGTRYSKTWEVINEPRSAGAENYYRYLIEYASKENNLEVPIAPATMVMTDPLIEKLVREISETTRTLIEGGYGKEDPRYREYTAQIEADKESLLEVATLLVAEESRTFQKGGSFGYHKLTVSLSPDVTMDQYLKFWTDEYFPKFVKLMKGLEVLILVPYNRPLEDQFVYVQYFRSESTRDRYWPEPDTPSDRTDSTMEQMKPLLFELLQMGTWEDDYGVWIIQ